MPTRRRPLFALTLLAALVGLVSGCSDGMPDAATRQGRDIESLYVIILIMAIVVFVAVDGAILYAVLRYRRRPGDETLPPQVHGNNLLELVWFLIPVGIVIALFAMSVRTLNRVDAQEVDPTVTVEVTGFQWQWSFKYPAEDFTVQGSLDKIPEMVLPVNEPIRIQLEALDVIHSFYVQEFNYKKDLIPGQINRFDMFPERTGTFGAQCAEFCGLLHNKMTFTVRVAERPEYERWVAERKEEAARIIRECGEPAETFQIAAQGIAFDKQCIPVQAGTPFTIEFDNRDPGILHNVAIYKTQAAGRGDELFVGRIFPGNRKEAYRIEDGIPAGPNAFFRCDVHPGMSGTVIIRS